MRCEISQNTPSPLRLVELTRARSPVWLVRSKPLGGLEARKTGEHVGTLANDIVSPPVDADLLPLQGKEGNNGGDRNTAVKCSRQDVVVLLPPCEVVLADVDLEGVGYGDGRPGMGQVVRSPVETTREK